MAAQVNSFETEAFTLTSGQTASAAVSLKNAGFLGLFVPTIDTGTLKLQVSADGAAFFDVHDTAGVLLSWGSGSGGFAVDAVLLDAALGYGYLRVVTGATQTSDRTFTLARKVLRVDNFA